MSYLLNKPYTKKQRADFIVEFNHNKNLKIVETASSLIALEVFETFENGNVISHKTEYEKEIEKNELKDQITYINQQIQELDLKRIRAVCEPSIKDEETNTTWLEYYNIQIQELRTEIQEIQERLDNYDIINKDLYPLVGGSE